MNDPSEPVTKQPVKVRVTNWLEKEMAPPNEMRQLRTSGVMSARTQRRAAKAVRRGREPMSRAERHARGMQ